MNPLVLRKYEVILPLTVDEGARDLVRDRLKLAVQAGRAVTYGNPWEVEDAKVGVKVTMTGVKAVSEADAIRKATYWLERVARAMALRFTGEGLKGATVKCLDS